MLDDDEAGRENSSYIGHGHQRGQASMAYGGESTQQSNLGSINLNDISQIKLDDTRLDSKLNMSGVNISQNNFNMSTAINGMHGMDHSMQLDHDMTYNS